MQKCSHLNPSILFFYFFALAGEKFGIDYLPGSAKRDRHPGNYSASEHAINLWAIEQLELLQSAPLNPIEQCFAAYGLVSFDVDPITIARVFITTESNGQPQVGILTFIEVLDLLNQMDVAIFRSKGLGESQHAANHEITMLPNHALIRPVRGGKFNNLEIESGIPKNNFSIIDCLHRTALSRGVELIWRIEENSAKGYFNMMMDAVIASARAS
jgi:hypothetical protein